MTENKETKKRLDIDKIKSIHKEKYGKNIDLQGIANHIHVKDYQQIQKWGSVKVGLPKIVNRLESLSEWLGVSINEILK